MRDRMQEAAFFEDTEVETGIESGDFDLGLGDAAGPEVTEEPG